MSGAFPRRVAGGAALLFGTLTALVVLHPMVAGDASIDRSILTHPGTITWGIAVAVSVVASGPLVALVAAAFALWIALRLRRPAEAIGVFLAPAVAGIAEVTIKTAVGRARPLTAVLSGESGNGYPSGHVSGFGALVVALGAVWIVEHPDAGEKERSVVWLGAAGVVVLVAWARIAVGAHYATDVVGGALLAVVIGLLCPWVAVTVRTRFLRSKATPV